MPDPHENMAPNFAVSIEGSDLGRGLTELVQSVEYESVDGIADEGRLTLSNPDLILADSPLWQPGNEMDVWFGYGTQIGHAGRVIIAKPEPGFPRGTASTISIKGYTRDQLMMGNTPKREEASTRDFEAILISEAVERVGQKPVYKFDTLDIDPTPNRYASVQKADIDDYEFVKGLSNITGFLFWVDYTRPQDGGDGWTLHFRDPETLHAQENEYTFEYNRGDMSTLLDFFPELSLTGSVTKIQAQVRNPDSGQEPFVVEFEDDKEPPDVRYRGNPEDVIEETHTTGGAVVKLLFGDYALEVVSDKQFKSDAELRWWAQQWFRRRRENFIIGRGTVTGVADMRARQTHNLARLCRNLDGRYYFARTRHTFDSTSGYLIDFSARKEFE